MRILLISVNRERNPYPVAPLGLGYVASALRAGGHEPRILDLCFSEDVRSDIAAAVDEFTPQAVGLSLRNLDNVCMISPVSYLDDLKAPFEIVRELGGRGFCIIVDPRKPIQPDEAEDFLGVLAAEDADAV